MFSYWLIIITITKLSTTIPDHRLIFMNDIPQFSKEERTDRISSSCEDLTTLLMSEMKMFDLVQKSCDQLENVHEAKKLIKMLNKLLLRRPKNMEAFNLKFKIAQPMNMW